VQIFHPKPYEYYALTILKFDRTVGKQA